MGPLPFGTTKRCPKCGGEKFYREYFPPKEHDNTVEIMTVQCAACRWDAPDELPLDATPKVEQRACEDCATNCAYRFGENAKANTCKLFVAKTAPPKVEHTCGECAREGGCWGVGCQADGHVFSCSDFVPKLDLLPCPFCGGEAYMLCYPSRADGSVWAVRCRDCGASGSEHPDTVVSRDVWNGRTK